MSDTDQPHQPDQLDEQGRLHGRFVVVPASYLYPLRGEGADTEVLLQLRRGTGFMDGHWAAAAAGHVEKGETAYDAVRREALEEIGLSDLELTYVTTMQRTQHGEAIDERVDFFFTTRAWSGEPRVLEQAKSAGLRWVRLDALDDLDEPVVPHEKWVLEAVRRGTAPAYSTFGFTQ